MMKKPSLREWVAAHRSELSDRFAEEYGNQIHEWDDFVEHEFELAFAKAPMGGSGQSPLPAGDHTGTELFEELGHASGPRF